MKHQMWKQFCLISGIVPAALVGASATAQNASSPNGALDAITTCRQEADAGKRLRCYDNSIDRLTEARRNQDITILTREEVTAQRQAVFGLPVDDGRLFPGQSEKSPAIQTRDSTVARIAIAGRDTFLVTLADRSIWRTTERARYDPKVGDPIHIRRGALGSYLGSFAGARSVRIERVR